MRELLFFLKMAALTFVVALLLQVHVGEKRIEQHFHGWLRNSIIVDWMQTAVDGGLTAARAGYSQAKGAMDPVFARFSKKKNVDGSERKLPSLKRWTDKEQEEMP